jgi:HlyD family secretion protein
MKVRDRSARTPLAIGFVAVALMAGGLGAWSVNTEISGAVVARGTVEVETERQVVQHPDGGVVGEILARDGDVVASGAVLVRLDGTFLESELAVVERQLAEFSARRARLVAERDGADAPAFRTPKAFTLLDPASIRELTDAERALFEARRVSLEQERSQIARQQEQIDRQIEGIEAQLAAQERQLALIGTEAGNVRSLLERGLVQAPRLMELEREEARLEGEIGRLAALVAEARTRFAGLAIETLRLGERRREEAITRLRDIEYAEIALEERRRSLNVQLARLDVRAPVSGTVFGSRVSALQSVVQPAEAMMYLVPGDVPLQISARIAPTDVEQVFAGQDVTLMLSAFSREVAPELAGKVVRVSADAQTDEATGHKYFEAVLEPDPNSLASLTDVRLVPGMPVDAFLKTHDRTPLSYLTQPLAVYFARAFRED